ncbi:MAG TPA: permease prefix domain 1-containing protein, partial [Vicinamibacterales bacterium]|nr:permease prefix domain 1-containing protein [Vicinamibacterales bacterium]
MRTRIRVAWARLVAFFRRNRLDREFDEELAVHLDMSADEHVRRGLNPVEARRAAARKLGGLDATRELHRETRGLPGLDSLLHDVRYSLRMLARAPGFSAVAVLVVGLSIGATTAVFSVVNALLLRPLPFQEPDRLVWIANTGTDSGLSGVTLRASNLRDWRRLNQSFTDLAGYFAFFEYGSYRLVADGEPERLI